MSVINTTTYPLSYSFLDLLKLAKILDSPEDARPDLGQPAATKRLVWFAKITLVAVCYAC